MNIADTTQAAGLIKLARLAVANEHDRFYSGDPWSEFCAALAAQSAPTARLLASRADEELKRAEHYKERALKAEAAWATHVQGCIEGWRVSADDQEATGHQETADTLRGCAADLARIHASPAPAEAQCDAALLNKVVRPAIWVNPGDLIEFMCARTPGTASPAPAEAKEEPTYCKYCQGSGESTHVVGRDPDAHDEPCNCDKCGGTGVFQAGRIVDVGQLEYQGNSVSFIHSKMKAYQYVLGTAWEALKKAGVKPDGNTSIAMGIERLATNSPTEVKEEPRNTATHDHLSTLIGLWLGARQRGDFKYAEGSAVDKAVKEAIEHLKDWPYPESTPQPQAAQPSPTSGMTLAQRILHVGGRNNAAGYVEFGSTQAVEALVRQVIRDLPVAPALTEEQEREAFEEWYAGIWRERTGKTTAVAELSAVVASMREGDGYTDGDGGEVPYLNNLWEGWQARAALRSTQGGKP